MNFVDGLDVLLEEAPALLKIGFFWETQNYDIFEDHLSARKYLVVLTEYGFTKYFYVVQDIQKPVSLYWISYKNKDKNYP